MKRIELLVGDYEYSQIEEIFEKEPDFQPISEKDQIIIKALKLIISKDSLMEENVGGEEITTTTIAKVEEPENKSLDEGHVEYHL